MFARAKAYYDRFLSLHEADDLDRTAATVALKKVEAELAKLGAARGALNAIKPGTWVDLLSLVNPAKHTVAGTWALRGGRLEVAPSKGARLMLPVAPKGDYELAVRFVRVEGDDAVELSLPVGAKAVSLILSCLHGKGSGLECIDGKYLMESGTAATPGTLENGREYALAVTVLRRGDEVTIDAKLDGKPLTKWTGPSTAFSQVFRFGRCRIPRPSGWVASSRRSSSRKSVCRCSRAKRKCCGRRSARRPF